MSELFRDEHASLDATTTGNTLIRFVCTPGLNGCASVRRAKLQGILWNNLREDQRSFGSSGFCQRHARAGNSGFAAPRNCDMDGSLEGSIGVRAATLNIDPMTLSNLTQTGITIEPGNPTGVVVNMVDQEEHIQASSQ